MGVWRGCGEVAAGLRRGCGEIAAGVVAGGGGGAWWWGGVGRGGGRAQDVVVVSLRKAREGGRRDASGRFAVAICALEQLCACTRLRAGGEVSHV